MATSAHPTFEPDQYMLKVLGILVDAAPGEMSNYVLYEKSRMSKDHFYPALSMLEIGKLVTSKWADNDTSNSQTRMYQVTANGLDVAKQHGKKPTNGQTISALADLAHG